MRGVSTLVAALLAAGSGCGGGKQTPKGPEIGSGHEETGGGPGEPAVGAPDGGMVEGPARAAPDAAAPAPPAAPVTFSLHNSADEDLVFSVDKGWQPVIFAYSGKPPKAKPILMFPKFCTASCDADQEERCLSCPEPEKVKDIKAAEKRETAATGKSVDVPWDGLVYAYEKTRGGERGKKCDCWKKVDPPAGEFTVKACGFRVSQTPGKSSKLQCVETTMTLPPASPLAVRLDFPAAK